MKNYKHYRESDLASKMRNSNLYFPLDIMVTGVTGAGKSTTLNAFFEKEVAKEGVGTDPETMEFTSYLLNDSLRLWDTPGLGDGIDADKSHSKGIIDLLYKKYTDSENIDRGFIDLVLIILDGSSRDMGTTYRLINNLIVPNMQKNRILVAINQADIAMKGRNWDSVNNVPNNTLKEFLDEKAQSIVQRVQEATGVSIKLPIYYSAKKSYNIERLFDFIIDNLPNKRRNLKK